MILTGREIYDEIAAGRITIDPFDESNITTNSYDFHLSPTLLTYDAEILDCKKDNPTSSLEIGEEGYVLYPGKVYLGSSRETMGSSVYVPMIHGTSSIGRMGLFVHITSDIFDIGAVVKTTLMFNATQPVRVYPDMKIGQVTFWKPQGDIEMYAGKYKLQSSPQKSLIHHDFTEENR